MTNFRTQSTHYRSFAVIPAAGRSKRMGTDKLLLPYRGATIFEKVVAAWKATPVQMIVVVTREDQIELIACCRELQVALVSVPMTPPQMKDTVWHGLQYIELTCKPSAHDVWLLAPADMPLLQPSVVAMIMSAHDVSSPKIIVPTHAGKRGHPVLFPWALAAEVAALRDSEGINSLPRRHPVREVECGSPAILSDLDTPDDYERLLSE